MERHEVSPHEVRVFRVLQRADGWLTNTEIAHLAHVAPRTARAHTQKLFRLGLVELAEVFPAHRYRLSRMAGTRIAAHAKRIAHAATVFGIEGDL